MPRTIPIRNLKDTSGISELYHTLNEPIFIKKTRRKRRHQLRERLQKEGNKMKKVLSMILVFALLAGCAAVSAETVTETAGFMIPATVTARFDAAMEELLPEIAGQYRLEKEDDAWGFLNLNYYSKEPAVTFSFGFPEGTEKSETVPASSVGFMLIGDMPEETEKAIVFCFVRTITDEYPDNPGLVQEIENWFASEKEPESVFTFQGYKITVTGEAPGFWMYSIEQTEEYVEAGEVILPSFLTPAVFTEKLNAQMDALADQYADELGEERVSMVKQFKLTKKDDRGWSVAYGTDRWDIEVTFRYPDGAQTSDNEPGESLNLMISDSVPEDAVKLAVYTFQMIIASEYQEEDITEELTEWFATVADNPNAECILPDGRYSLLLTPTESGLYYAIVPKNHNDWEIMRQNWTDDTFKAAPADVNALRTISIAGYEYVMGKSTPQDFVDDGWTIELEDGQFMYICDADGNNTGIYIKSRDNAMDAPVTRIEAVDAEILIEYCGFDGSEGSSWEDMENWLIAEYGAEIVTEEEETFCEARIPVFDGQYTNFFIFSYDSAPVLALEEN